jgi:hypothetical protein
MPATVTTEPSAAALGSQAKIAENTIHRALATVAAHAVWWRAMLAQAARLNVSASQIIPAALVERNNAAVGKAEELRLLVAKLHANTAAIQPWRTKADPTIHWAIVKTGEPQPLGLAWLVPALWIVGSGLVASAGLYLASATIAATKTANDARKLDAETRAAVAASPAAKDPKVAAALLAAMNAADKEAQSGVAGWLGEVAGTAAAVTGTGIGVGAVLLLAMAYGRRAKKR